MDLLQSALAGRTGNFHIRRSGLRIVLRLEEGRLRLISPDGLPPGALLLGLVHRGMLDDDLRYKMTTALQPLQALDHFVETNVVPADEVERLIRESNEDVILDLLTWRNGGFSFHEGEDIPDDAGLCSRVPIDVDAVLLLAAKRCDEQEAMRIGLGPEPHLFVPVEGQAPTAGFSGDPVVHVHAMLDGVRVTDEIVQLAGMTRFDTLRAVLSCVNAGAARPATPEELWAGASARIQRGESYAARALILQWTALAPEDRGEVPPDAVEPVLRVLRGRLTRHPGEVNTLEAMAAVAEAVGDTARQAGCVVDLARIAVEEDDAERAAALFAGLETSDAMPLRMRMLRGRAFLAVGDREHFVAEAEAVRTLLGSRCRGEAELEAARFFRDGLATLAPERADLGRELTVAKRLASPLRRFGPVAALLILLATAAVVFWPASASTILERAQAAAAAGNDTTALGHLAELLDRYPESPEARRAILLRERLTGSQREDPDAAGALHLDDERVEGTLAACRSALPRLPAPDARVAVTALDELLRADEGRLVWRDVLGRIDYDIRECSEHLTHELRERTALLLRATDLTADDAGEKELRDLVARTSRWAEDGYAGNVAETIPLLERLLDRSLSTATRRAIRSLESALERHDRTAESQAGAVEACRRAVMRIDLLAAHQRCLTEGASAFTEGRLDDAVAYCDDLRALLERLHGEPVFAPLATEAESRGIPLLIQQRTETIAQIRRSLASAEAAEKGGDLEAALEGYANLALHFRNVRLENVIQAPLRVHTVPEGAEVSVNGVVIGTSPLVVHYPWSTRVELTVAREGYEPSTEVVAAHASRPPASVTIAMAPAVLWSVTVDSPVAKPPASAEDDLVVCDRAGHVHLYRGATGELVWTREVEGVADMRARPVACGGLVYLPRIDGRVPVLDLYDGRVTTTITLVGNLFGAAVLGDLVGVVNLKGDLVAVRGRNVMFRSRFGATPSAGLIAAHDAFWLGTDDGNVVRLAPKDKQGVRLKLSGRAVPVRGIAAHAGGVLLAKADGTLHALARDGTVLWTVDALGDVIGAPAASAGRAACIDARGHVMLFDLADGTPRGQIDLGTGPRGTLRSTAGLLVTILRDGRLWIHDPATGTERANVHLGGDVGWFDAASHGDDRLVVPGPEGTLRVMRIPGTSSD